MEAGVANHIDAVLGQLDSLDQQVQPQQFNRALASYSLYYANFPEQVIKIVYDSLQPGGIFFFCGPAQNNNAELKQFHETWLDNTILSASKSAIFMEVTGQNITRELFSKIEIVKFENALRFNSTAALFDYWSSYNLYNETLLMLLKWLQKNISSNMIILKQ